MQWTEELNRLLNQCVFECSYDFVISCELLQTRATQLRLISDESLNILTAEMCQNQWIMLNPMTDIGDDDETYDEAPLEELIGGVHLHMDESFMNIHNVSTDQVQQHSAFMQPEGNEENQSTLYSDGPPRLELSLSETELDNLLRALPSLSCADPAFDGEDESTHASQPKQPTSELQWVLSFLTDPDAIATHNAEAKNLLDMLDYKDEDDNYQLFLQELKQAQLGTDTFADTCGDDYVPDATNDGQTSMESHKKLDQLPTETEMEYRQMPASLQPTSCSNVSDGNKIPEEFAQQVESEKETSEDDNDTNDDDDDDWEFVRQSIKSKSFTKQKSNTTREAPSCVNSCSTKDNYRRPRPNFADMNDIVLPPAPIRKMPPSPPLTTQYRTADNERTEARRTDHQALTLEIESFLKMHGKFQFPKHLFPHHNDKP